MGKRAELLKVRGKQAFYLLPWRDPEWEIQTVNNPKLAPSLDEQGINTHIQHNIAQYRNLLPHIELLECS